MRTTLSLLSLVFILSVTVPAQAQFREAVPAERSQTRLYDQGTPTFSLNKLFSPEHFQMRHTYEMSMGSFGGSATSLGMYTNSMLFEFSPKLAARVDLSFAHSPFGGMNALGQQDNTQFFLRNAEIAYRPTENTQFHFSIRQSPYGSYMGPYGYSPFYRDDLGHGLFWSDGLR